MKHWYAIKYEQKEGNREGFMTVVSKNPNTAWKEAKKEIQKDYGWGEKNIFVSNITYLQPYEETGEK